MALDVLLEFIGLPVILLFQGFPHLAHPLGRLSPWRKGFHYFVVRVLRPAVRFSRPQGDVIQGDAVFHRAAIDQGAQFAVPQGQGFLEEGGRFVVMKQERLLFVTGQACQAKGPADKYGGYSHIEGFSVSGGLSTLPIVLV